MESNSLAGTQMHEPMVPPSFPVLVVSEIRVRGLDNGSPPSWIAHHSFIEVHDMKRFLGLD